MTIARRRIIAVLTAAMLLTTLGFTAAVAEGHTNKVKVCKYTDTPGGTFSHSIEVSRSAAEGGGFADAQNSIVVEVDEPCPGETTTTTEATTTTTEATTTTTLGTTTTTTLGTTTTTTLGTTTTQGTTPTTLATTTTAPEVLGTTITTVPEVSADTLPFTGFEAGDTVRLGMLAMLAGGLMLFAVRGRDEEENAATEIGGWSNL